ncbi:hypothetical protein IB274_25210 [Pseudomonas sp. PDM18]|uniref:hypothetical protein n=1 Tax=Pseudomonas sp. PDM18 TaxID=2769253 RepID=UPI0017842AD4|nr:hypothetical protein [Pseudomonas sp. PDM18]MBD9680029.1 hypothetical protein [Pseudomonas sp. PDM18]
MNEITVTSEGYQQYMLERDRLREAIFSTFSTGGMLAKRLDWFFAENDRLLALERSILEKARWLREGGWFHAEEEGVAGEIHAAITALHTDLENEGQARMAAEQKLKIILEAQEKASPK